MLVFVFDKPLDHERLINVQKLKILVELRGHPDPAVPNAPVPKLDLLMIRPAGRLKPPTYIAQQGRLIFFHRKVVVRTTSHPSIRQTRDKVFQTPLIEWIEERLSQFRELLETNTNDSALVLHNLLGPEKLEAKYPDIGKPYYLVYTSIYALAITEPSPNCKSTDNAPFQWWARSQRIRTSAGLVIRLVLID